MNRARSSVKVSKYFQRVFARNFHASVANCMRVCSCCQQHKRPEPDFKVHDYNKVFRRSIDSPEDFWAEQADDLIWEKKWDKVLDNSNPPFTKWFVGGELNTCYNAVDRHVAEGNGGQVAIIYDSPVTKQIKKITYRELWEEVSLFAGVLQKNGVKKGDRVLIYMPMIPQAIVAMLASARLGAIHSLVFGGFASKELSTRIEHAKPKVIVSANYGVEPGKLVPYKPLLDGALKMISFRPQKCIIYNRPGFDFTPLQKGRDLDYTFELSQAYHTDCVPVSTTDPIYLLYTSGTTGLPKAVVRPSGGHAVVLKWSMWNIYGIRPGEVWWSASDLGWVVGHSYICYAPLLNGNTTVLFEGKPVGTPDPGVYFRIIKEHNVVGLFVAPTALRAIRRDDPEGAFGKKFMPLNSFRNMFVAGEHCDRETMEWTKKVFNCPVLDNWWQTETGWAITSTCVGLGMPLNPTPGVTGKPVPGWNVKVLKDDFSKETKDLELGQIIVKLPLPPGSCSTLWENDYRFQNTYFDLKKGFYNTMDSGYRDKEGYVAVMSRSDDVINVAGHRLSAGALEEAIIDSPYIAEAAVIGVPDELKGEVPLGLCVPKHGLDKSDEQIKQDVIRHVRDSIGPVASFKLAILVPKLPKTRSGKIARNTIAAMAAGKPFKIPVTIEDDSVYPAIRLALKDIGYAPDPPSDTTVN
ncbi:acyl-CoA synthetase short-chain family member 3, mitochondrial-like isoform X1 [Ruditapes philippinarum]|uniref:acyl-CoA synthetase short-chain family member 3, mitochondrial-like isoform X1 n=1 Tax=Ruditapes philippinarum TaxID=129788 RepID=UPI00295C3015|nr:acyl-CoA synthetase short-chain family member 3, mitochondrial-like isoform X1 [Ruditapes philippinarum]